jgi:hypothetical protein
MKFGIFTMVPTWVGFTQGLDFKLRDPAFLLGQ